jgi:excisionase family DNA binding protein
MADLIITTQDQLEKLIENSVRKVIGEQSNNSNPDHPGELLNMDEAAKFIGVAKPTLYTYTSKRIIPFIKRGGKIILFRLSDLQKWLQEGKRESISEANNRLNNI